MSPETVLKAEIEQIEGLSVKTGLERVYGRWDVYRRSLKLTLKEIQKCDKNLKKFLAEGDMDSFSIEAHCMKGLLANIGALELSPLAFELETGADRKDIAFCTSALPPFLEALRELGSRIAEVFAREGLNRGHFEIPEGLRLTFDRLKAAIKTSDFSSIDAEMEILETMTLNHDGALDMGLDRGLIEEIEDIKDLVMVMDYDSALRAMKELQIG